MDGSVERTIDRSLIPAAPARGRVGRDRNGGTFQLDAEDSEGQRQGKSAEAETEEEVLPVGEATYDEAGKRLDVTA